MRDAVDEQLKLLLKDLPHEYGNRYTEDASRSLLKILFYSLSNGDHRLLLFFFPDGPPASDDEPWKLSVAQGAVDGAEYTEAARGKPCGHVFRDGETTYSCKTCTTDDTCVLCAKCFEASDHEGHQVTIGLSHGMSGCCDCGDPEAWVRPLSCSIHTSLPESSPADPLETDDLSLVPEALQSSIRSTISRVFDYLCDVFSCSPEQMRTPKSEETIRENEIQSRLSSWYGVTNETEQDSEFALVLWNDEKHTLDEVQEQVARACSKPRWYGQRKAREVDDVGRSIVEYSRSVADLIHKAKILAQIKVTVTIRSARDTFREQMCETIIQWLADIAGCSVGKDHRFLMNVICEEMLRPWRIGSSAFNLSIAKGGIIDHAKSDDRLRQRQAWIIQNRVRMFQEQARRARQEERAVFEEQTTISDEEILEEDEDADEDEEDVELDEETAEEEADEMDVDDGVFLLAATDPDEDVADAMIEIRTARAEEDEPLSATNDAQGEESDEEGPTFAAQTDPNKLFTSIPRTKKHKATERPIPPTYWINSQKELSDSLNQANLRPHEDMHKRVRIDHLVFYDMRMWKNLRDILRHFYISTVVSVPSFKRILSLRFAALYTHLAQLYLLADREADHSIINLSLQMLTTPSITEEVVRRSNFFTRLLAILYTFLTRKQVGEPEDIDPTASVAFETGTMANRRVFHVFSDMRYLLESSFVREAVRTKHEYLLQFLDFAKLFQGICPNVRAVGEHVEYESDAWISASILIKEVTRLCRQFSDCFRWNKSQDPASICRAIRQAAKVTIINSMGAEAARFPEAELTKEIKFKTVGGFQFEDAANPGQRNEHTIVECVVETNSMSFHHALHYTLSWLIDSGKSMSSDQLESLLQFSQHQLQPQDSRSTSKIHLPPCAAEQYILALFDIPLRVCAWLAQMRAGMWVRNGITLRHQMGTFRSVNQRDVSYQRDLFMLQTAFAVGNPATFLASVIDRFGMVDWMKGNFRINKDHEDQQMVDVAEDFIHLLIVLLCDRTLLLPPEEDPHPKASIAKRDVIHALCFKPLTFSDLTARLSEKVYDMEGFQNILQEVASYRPPEGLADSGTLILNEDFYVDVDPYQTYYNKSQREEAENIYRSHKAKRTGKHIDEVFYEPKLRPIRSGIFTGLGRFSQQPLFAQVIYCSLLYVLEAEERTPNIAPARIEAFLQVVLHLVLVAIQQDRLTTEDSLIETQWTFPSLAFDVEIAINEPTSFTIVGQLFTLLKIARYQASKPRIRFALERLRQSRPDKYETTIRKAPLGEAWRELVSTPEPDSTADQTLKKKQALARQAKVMASFKKQQSDFMENQKIDWGLDEASDTDDFVDVDDKPLENRVWEVPTGNCILCQAESADEQLYGTLAYMEQSALFRETDLQDADYVSEVCATPHSLDRSAEAIRPFGVAGHNMERITKVTAGGIQVESERRGLGKGFPMSYSKSGPMVTGCGHIMHFSCFLEYNNATEKRHLQQYTRNHPEQLERKEFVCPLCKALGNAFMPIVWKPRQRVAPSQPDPIYFNEWISEKVPVLMSSSRELPLSQEVFVNYASESLIPGLTKHLLPPGLNQSGIRISPSFFTMNEPGHGATYTRTSSSRNGVAGELSSSYLRLKETLTSNNFATKFGGTPTSSDELSRSDTLADMLGYSIAAVEIAQRGVDSLSSVFVNSIPQQTVTQLRVFSETVSAYVALGALQPSTKILSEAQHCAQLQFKLLFGHDTQRVALNWEAQKPLLAQDIFVFLASCSVFLDPLDPSAFHHIVRLCYLAEIIKVVVAVLRSPTTVKILASKDSPELHAFTSQEDQVFSVFVQGVLQQYQMYTGPMSVGPDGGLQLHVDENPNDRVKFDQYLHGMVLRYALTFVRKCALLLHVRYNVDYSTFDSALGTDADELARLSNALGLPSIDDLITSFISNDPVGQVQQGLAACWISDWQVRYNQVILGQDVSNSIRSFTIRVPHPSIFELVALPYTHDTLNAVTMSRRCPTTGRDLTDPNVCLFCGAVFCGQATCCSQTHNGRTEGGCYRHQQVCGGSIGMFLNIRKCAVVFLHRDNGSWFTPPYLDKHGEVDLGLRRKQQLFLHQKRYDKLFRDVWLGANGGVPSAVARKLESDINGGGWETL